MYGCTLCEIYTSGKYSNKLNFYLFIVQSIYYRDLLKLYWNKCNPNNSFSEILIPIQIYCVHTVKYHWTGKKRNTANRKQNGPLCIK